MSKLQEDVKPRQIPSWLCPLNPSEKQRLFLESWREQEVFFGGAAGGGKSVALLMGALEYVHVSGYAALILRKDFARLELAGGLIPRSQAWFQEAVLDGKAKWVASRRQWIFPVEGKFPATIMFGYLKGPMDKFRYASSEFQYIAFDELTEFTEEDYLFLFSRLRRNTSLQVPLRMRSASNPGGVGHLWVKERFVAESGGPEAKEVFPGVLGKRGRLYIPSRIADNTALDEAEYRQTLLHLPALVRERLMNGDWSVAEQGLIHAAWLRYFVEVHDTESGDHLDLLEPSGRSIAIVPDGSCRRFVTIDPAGTSAERTREARGKGPSWTVVQVWDQPVRELSKFLLLRHQVRVRVGFDGLCHTIRDVFDTWRPERVWIEGEKLGQAVYDVFKETMPIDCLRIGVHDKATRAGKLLLKLEKGEIFLPRHESSWRPGLEAELLAWTGDERQVADQIDAAAYAAIVAGHNDPKPIKIGPAVVGS